MRTLLTFCYFLICLAVVSCGESTDTKKSQVKEVEADTPRIKEQSDTDIDVIMFYGTSLTAGLGVSPTEAFPAVIQKRIDSLYLPYEVVNAGVSGETTAGGKSRLDWVLDEDVDVFVLELGANDGLRGLPVEETEKNLQAIIDAVQKQNPRTQIILAGMQLPPNMGQEYTSQFKAIFPRLAKKNNLPLIPFLLKDVGGVTALNQPDGIHPTPQGHKIIAENVWQVLQPILKE